MNAVFDGLDNMFGTIKPDIRKRLQAVIDNPCLKTWGNSYSIILSWRRNYTLWQAVIAVDPTFPRMGPRTDQRGKVLENWQRIPNRDTILKAILLATEEGVKQ